MTIEMPAPEVQSVGVQCNLLVAPQLRMLKNLEDVNEESLPSEVEETDLDTSFLASQEENTTEKVQMGLHLLTLINFNQ